MRCRLALPAVLTLLALPLGTGCRLGGGSSMTSWLPGQGSAVSDGEELASAPPFEGEIVKPSTKATPYPTTSTPQGYVVGQAGQTPPAAELVQATPPAGSPPTAPVTYGMKPADVAAVSGATAAAAAPGGPAATDTIAAQEGPYAPLNQATLGEGAASPPTDTVVSGFSAAGGTSAGAYPPEETVGLAPAASETAAYPTTPPAAAPYAAEGTFAQPAAGMATSANTAPQTSAFAAPPGAAFATQPEPPPAVSEGGSAFGQSSYAGTEAPASAFGQEAAVPQGAASESPVAGQRYASAGSRFGGGYAEPAATAATVAGTEEALLPPPQQQPPGTPWQDAPAEPAAATTAAASAWPAAAASPAAAATPPADENTSAEPAAFGTQASQPGSPEAGRPNRRPDPMYRPAGTSSYRPSEPIFPSGPSSRSPVQMATFEETVPLPPQQ